MPRLLRQFDEKPGLSLTALGMTQDTQGHLWMATINGIVRYQGGQFRVFHDPVLKEGDYYYQLVSSVDGRIWLKQGSGLSLAYVDTRQQRIVRLPDSTRVVRDYLARYGSHYLFTDAQASLWIGLKDHGLLKLNPRTLAVKHIVDQGLDIRSITQDRQGVIYFATSKQGLFAYNPQTEQLTNYRHDDKNTTSLSSNAAYGVQARPDGSILVGQINEASVFSPATGQFRRLGLTIQRTPETKTPGAPYIYEFKLDARGNAYFSTGVATYCYTAQGTLQQLGFGSPTHFVEGLYVDTANRLWVSTSAKLYAYDLNQTRVSPSLLFLRLTINGTLLKDNTSATQNLTYDTGGHPTLTVRENEPFTMQFTPVAKIASGTLRWRLNGYDNDWISSQDVTGYAAYQLPAGTYTFTVNQGYNTGKWEPTVSTLTIVVVAPFWKTPAFLALMGLVVGGLGYYLIRAYRRRRQLAQQLAREQQEAASLRQLDELKTRFFSNVTHEFRTPLTIILNATEQLTAKTPAHVEQPEVATIQRHAHQLLRLITETLDMARLDAGKLESHLQLGNPVWFAGQVVAQFAGLAAQRGLDLTYNDGPATQSLPVPDFTPTTSSTSDDLVSFDSEKWEKIIYNLLANALKFTPPGGSVRVRGHIRADTFFVLSISDTGIGIPADQQEHIFERFHQVDSRATRAYSGTGIGLALVRELTIWLGGEVTVTSQPGQGSTFTVQLPLTIPSGADSTLAASPSFMIPPMPEAVRNSATAEAPEFTSAGVTSKPLILVVEDNEDLRAQVADYLSGTYQVVLAENGRLGWEQALASVPDLIISDVMMPELDGYELLERLKNDERTSHIPVILLTARSASESRMRGLQTGADEYLVKPFSLAELLLRIGNGLRTRQNWQKRFLSAPSPVRLPTEPVLNREEAFLDRLRQAIMAHLAAESIDVDWLAAQAHMSRTQLNRKLSALTSLSPNRFIQRVRLERGAELLASGTLTVAEVAYQIGYQSPSHFTKVFQEHFGYPPVKLKS
ncbi:ATP-binding protein [Spirosoma sp. KUDC1026]|uniref:hybrid sensor histidine kinase/response regulator transcription factor n=1 Tax=Spirosoma sp. KUDC1026 TaxID=2745947 RepID=UPI00159BBF8E|nr:ATP-binding protein [Spirosoma sp. KUDC1026]QKZ12648.1 response regulator [Spirosoma sp. KUDC1026]